jgi:thioesterase domain-containing protein
VTQLECTPVPGKHMTMLKKPHVEAIAGHVWKLWSRPRRNGARLLYDVASGDGA